MTLLGIFGALGSGKTLILTYFAWLAKTNANAQVITNYWTDFSDKIMSIEECLLMMDDLVIPNVPNIFCFDELGALLKAVDFLSSENEIMTPIFLKSRKKGADIYYSSQSAMMVDRQVRRITDLTFDCRYKKKTQQVEVIVSENMSTHWIRKSEPLVYDATLMFNKYNTYEIVQPDRMKILDYLKNKMKKDTDLLERLREQSKRRAQLKLMVFKYNISLTLADVLLELVL